MKIKAFFDKSTFTLTYIVYDPETKDAMVIDPVWDYDPQGSKTNTESITAVTSFIDENNLKLNHIIETHAHADHLSGSQILKEYYPDAVVVINDKIKDVQQLFKGVFALPEDFPVDGSQFDYLVKDGEKIKSGSLEFEAIATPGHTPACMTYKIGDAIFTGDALFMPDYGTGRCDFPAGSAEDLYDSITERIYTLPDETRIFVGHDYLPNGRDVAYETTVGESKEKNVQLNSNTSKDEFVKFRKERDSGLKAPRLLYQSVQVNIAAGQVPDQPGDDKGFLKIPVNIFNQKIDPSELEEKHTVEFAEV